MDPNNTFEIKNIQSGEITRFELSEIILNKKLKDILRPMLKGLKLKEKDVFLSIESGKMLGDYHLNLPLKMVIEQFGTRLNLYSETIL